MSELRIKIKYTFFCDDVRREDNGKFIFIGVYTGHLVLPAFPWSVRLSIFAHGNHDGSGQREIAFRVLYAPLNIEIHSFRAMAEGAEGADASTFDFKSSFSFQAQQEGHLSLQFSQGGEGWREMESLPVRASAAPSPSA